MRPGDYLVIEEFQGFQSPKEVGELGALSNLYFAGTSEAGTWSMKEIATWQREVGLSPRKPIRLFTAPGAELQGAFSRTPQGKTGTDAMIVENNQRLESDHYEAILDLPPPLTARSLYRLFV